MSAPNCAFPEIVRISDKLEINKYFILQKPTQVNGLRILRRGINIIEGTRQIDPVTSG